ncbi:MAG: NUDIX hydrolase [Candidatus Methylomirabilota bacterium]
MSMPPRIGTPQTVYENRYQRVVRLQANVPGCAKEYFVTEFGERVGVVPVRGSDVLLVQQYRLIARGLSWEIPGGGLDAGEDPEAAVRRECLEEAGIRIRSLVPLLSYHLGLDTLWNPTYLYYSDSFDEIQHTPDRGEVVGRAWIPFARVQEMIRRGEIQDSMSLLALLAFRMRMQDGEGQSAASWGVSLESRFPERRPDPPSRMERPHD